MDDALNFDSVESIYRSLNGRDEIRARALLILRLRHWLTEVSNFDPVSGHAMRIGIVDFMDAVAKSMWDESPEGELKDRIYRIVSHTKEAVMAIMEHTRDKILREHAILPIHAAREVDSNSIQWLSRLPGRTVREKLSGKPYMKAVRRRSSVDTAENRLLKFFLRRLEQILIERQNALSTATEETCEELLVSLQRWLRTEDTDEIGAWGNLPPNNTLLQDKRYRKVWDGWLWLQAIDEQITRDSKRVRQDLLSVIYWNTLSLLNRSGRFRTVQQPVGLDYDNFSISPELPVRGYLFPAYFVTGTNQKGEYADNATLLGENILIEFNLTSDKWKLQVGEDEYSLQIISGNLVIKQARDEKAKLKIEPATLKEIPKEILLLVTDTPFESSKPTNYQSAPMRMDNSVVDLCSIRPTFTNNTGSQAPLPFRLLLQNWPLNVHGGLVIDCGYTKSIALHSYIETVSMRSLFSHTETLSDTTKSNASMFFTKKLSDYIKVDKLTYLVPDWGNDFDLEGIRKSVNFYFDESTPLPKSIAAIFAWQSSKNFVQDRVRENDFVLVVDSFDGGISITPVQAIYQKELHEILPKTQGMSWERHPTVIVPEISIYTVMSHTLDRDGCQTSEELLRLFGFDGLVSDSGKVSFVKDDHWYHLPSSIREVLAQDLALNKLSNEAIDNCLKSTNMDRRRVNVFILPLEGTIRKPDLRENCRWLGSTWSPIKGGQTLNIWQEKADDIALWRDHLPELSIRILGRGGHYENFYLVKNATVTPQRGRTVNIPVEESFTLPAGRTHYTFPLQQGEGNKKLHFVAYLKSPAFPLKEHTACKLKMTYTYGADDPYELKLIPLDSTKAGFKSIRVEWRSASEGETADLENLPVPDFPDRKSWSDFQKFPKKDGEGFSDLLNWIESKLILLEPTILRDEIVRNNVDRQVSIFKRERVVGKFKWGKTNNKGDYYCFVGVDDKDIYCSASNFKENVHRDSLQEGQAVHLNIIKKQDRSFGIHVSFCDEFPPGIAQEIYEHEKHRANISHEEIIQENAGRLEKALYSLRFPVLTIWNDGHSLFEPDVPHNFRTAILEAINRALHLLDSDGTPDTLKEELFFFLSCLHKDAPEIVHTRLLDAAQDGQLLKKNNKNIAFAIGNAELLWQQQLLRNIIYPIDNEGLIRSITLENLAIVLWRSKELIFKLSEKDLKKLCNDLFRCIQFDMKLLTSDIPDYRLQFHLKKRLTEQEARRRERSYQTNTLCKHLELLLALLRSRGIEDKGVKMIFAPDNDLANKYVNLVDDISKSVIEKNIELKSRISLQIEKPDMFRNTPDLLYALRMYLTGDSGANTIVVTGVSDED